MKIEKQSMERTVSYSPELGIDIDVRFANETVWLNQKQMAVLFQTSIPNINKHIKAAFKKQGFNTISVINKMEIVSGDGKKYKTAFYNLDLLLYIGYKIHPVRLMNFRHWVDENLTEYHMQMNDSTSVICDSKEDVNALVLSVKRPPGMEIIPYPDEQNKALSILTSQITIWLTQDQISQLFKRERSVITRHINNIFEEKELEENSVCAFFAHTAPDGKRYIVKFYNLDVVISIGYRVKSARGTLFRQWATKILKEKLLKKQSESKSLQLGNVIHGNDVRLVLNGDELQQIARSILSTIKPEFNDHNVFLVLDTVYSDLNRRALHELNLALSIPGNDVILLEGGKNPPPFSLKMKYHGVPVIPTPQLRIQLQMEKEEFNTRFKQRQCFMKQFTGYVTCRATEQLVRDGKTAKYSLGKVGWIIKLFTYVGVKIMMLSDAEFYEKNNSLSSPLPRKSIPTDDKKTLTNQDKGKIQSISVYPDDMAVLRKLKHYIEEQTGAMNVPVSAIYRAAIHLIAADEKFLDFYKKLKQ